MKPASLQRRLVRTVIGLITLGLLIADFAGVMLLRYFQIQSVDDQLTTTLQARLPSGFDSRVSTICGSGPGTETAQLPTSFLVVILDSDGQTQCQIPQAPAAAAEPQILFSVDELAGYARTESIVQLTNIGGHVAWRARIVRIDSGFAIVAVSLEDVAAMLRRLASISLVVGVCIVIAGALGSSAAVRVALRPLRDIEHTAEAIAAGDISRRIEVPTPKTEVGRLSISLNQMLAQIQAAFEERDRTEQRLRRFVADASHELRTPLATIRGHAELVRHGVASTPEEIATVLSRIESESIRLSTLVNDLLQLARLDKGPALAKVPVDALSVAADSVADAQVLAPNRHLQITQETDGDWQDVAPTVMGDAGRLKQVFTNLLDNAIKYTPATTPIEVHVGVRDDRVHLIVVDHGPGLKQGNEERVFERFFREEAGRSREHGGAGLGLAIAWTLVQLHNGELSYRPTLGGGSTFEVVLPIASP